MTEFSITIMPQKFSTLLKKFFVDITNINTMNFSSEILEYIYQKTIQTFFQIIAYI